MKFFARFSPDPNRYIHKQKSINSYFLIMTPPLDLLNEHPRNALQCQAENAEHTQNSIITHHKN